MTSIMREQFIEELSVGQELTYYRNRWKKVDCKYDIESPKSTYVYILRRYDEITERNEQ